MSGDIRIFFVDEKDIFDDLDIAIRDGLVECFPPDVDLDFPYEIDKNHLCAYCESTYRDFFRNLTGENAKSAFQPIILH